MHLRTRPVFLTGAALLAMTAGASAQSVADVVDDMYSAAQRYSEGVENYTVVQNVMGFSATTYFERETVDGRPVFRARQSSAGGFNMSMGDEGTGYGDVFAFGPELVQHARYGGRDEVEGRAVHVLVIDDLSALDMVGPSSPDDMDFVATSGRMYIDVELSLPKRMEFEGQATNETGVHDVTSTVTMRDFRAVDGLMLPHATTIEISGFEAMVDPETQAQIDEMMAQLENMPADRRAMLEQMLGPRIEQLKEMAGGAAEGAMTMEVEVTEVRVNAGPPSG